MPTTALEPMLSAREAAAIARCSLKTLRAAYTRGDFPVYRLTDAPNCPVRIRPADLAAWIESRQRQHVRPARVVAASRREAYAASDPRAFASGAGA